METFYLAIVVVLVILAVSDLIVGVSNDAVNFLNSAIGSKVAPFRIILFIAAIGVLFGATFSSGMMEVARKGIFNPQLFYFQDIMIVFLAVMLTDVLLLDFFNTMGLPTSTTVSIVFELLGSAVGVAFLKVRHGLADNVGDFINSERALLIISGILLSVVVSFTVGAIVQYISRLLFSFNYNKTIKYLGSIWGGIALTSIVYFILIKGAKGSSFMQAETVSYIKSHTWLILAVSFTGFTVLMQLLYWFFKVNVLKVVVLAGTFALAMAFAGNDLVNFIGVPLAGIESFKAFVADGGGDASLFSMEILQAKVKTPTLYLLIAGLVMVITLWFSKKSRSVVRTTLNLSRQDEGVERFDTSGFARALVRGSVAIGNTVESVIPNRISKKMSSRFNQNFYTKEDSGVSFDLVRASVNLVVASILIAFATSLKLPLSTTYVTFMVAMGTSLADGAWDRESAVYRVTGVITVIGGWFLTAFSAFTVALIMALILKSGGVIAIGGLIVLALVVIIRTHKIHAKRQVNESNTDTGFNTVASIDKCRSNVVELLVASSKIYNEAVLAVGSSKRKKLKKAFENLKVIDKNVKLYKSNIHKTLRELTPLIGENIHYYVQVVDYLREYYHSLNYIVTPAYNHVDNNHKPMRDDQAKDLELLNKEVGALLTTVIKGIEASDFKLIDNAVKEQARVIDALNGFRKKQIKTLQKESISTKASIIYLDILNETKNLSLHLVNIFKAFRDFEGKS